MVSSGPLRRRDFYGSTGLLTGFWMGMDARATGCAAVGHRGMCNEGLVCSLVVLSLGPATPPLSPRSEASLK